MGLKSILVLVAIAAIVILVFASGVQLPEGLSFNQNQEGTLPSDAATNGDEPDFSAEGGLNINTTLGWNNQTAISEAEAARIEALTQVDVAWMMEQNEHKAEVMAALQNYEIQAQQAQTQAEVDLLQEQTAAAIDKLAVDAENYEALTGSETNTAIANNTTKMWGIRIGVILIGMLVLGFVRGTVSAYKIWAPLRAITVHTDQWTKPRITEAGDFHIVVPPMISSILGLGKGEQKLVYLHKSLPLPSDSEHLSPELLLTAAEEHGKARIAESIANARPDQAGDVATRMAQNLGSLLGALQVGAEERKKQLLELRANNTDKEEPKK